MKQSTYDFIILGAGTSGCYLAERLSRHSEVKVLILDAGSKSRNPVFRVPAGFTQTFFRPKYNWCFRSEPEIELNHRSIFCPRGKVVGGSSMINGMIHSIGQREDYDSWQQDGCPDWTGEKVMGRFQTLFQGNGADAGLTIAEPYPLGTAFREANEELGQTYAENLHESQSHKSVGSYYHTVRNGQRWCVRSVLAKLSQRKNVTFATRVHIEKLFLSKNRVVKLRIIDRKKNTTDLNVEHEIIVSLGAIGSPALLQRSGIGPAEKLKKVGLQPAIELPCGDNLQDHLLVKKSYQVEGVKTYNHYSKGWGAFVGVRDYFMKGTGPLAAGASASGAVMSVLDDALPDTQVFFSNGSAIETPTALVPHKFEGVTIGSYFLRPESRGTVEIASTDPFTPPRISFQYLSSEKDWKATLGGLDYVDAIMNHKAFMKYNPKPIHEDCGQEEYIRNFAETAHHSVGTCAMGDKGVVDQSLKVWGLDNLRIADASVLPRVISGNTQAICAVVGDILGETLIP